MLHKICLLRPNLSRLFLLFVLVLCATAAGSAQLVLDGFDPNANDTIFAVVVQPDGKILIGGAFTKLSPNGGMSVARKYIARDRKSVV